MWTGSWPSLELSNARRSLKALESLVRESRPGAKDDLDAALARFLVVRTCGYLEQVLEGCGKAYLTSKADARSASFGASWLGRGRNPTREYVVSFVNRFDAVWAYELNELFKTDDELLARELTYLVDRRNRIAHGLSESVGVRKALDLVATTERLAEWLIARFDPR